MQLGLGYFMPAAGKSSAKTALHDFPGFVWSLKIYSIKFCHLFFWSTKHNTQSVAQSVGVLANSVISGPRISAVVFVNGAHSKCVSVKTVLYHHIIIHARFQPAPAGRRFFCYHPPPSSWAAGVVGSAINFATFTCSSSSCSSSGRRCVLVRLQLDTTHNQYNPLCRGLLVPRLG